MSSIVNKIKDAVHSDKSHSSTAEGTHGPHNSRMANAADPRVDSDRDGSHHVGGTTAHTGTHATSDNYTYGGSGFGHDGPASNTAGPHNSNLLNKADPRVDSDRDGSRNLGASQNTVEGAHGPHNSRMANTLDPRVDSDRDGSRTVGGNNYGSTGAGLTGTHGTHNTYGTTEGNHGPHNSKLANTLDPRVDSDRDGSRTVGGNNYGSTGAGLTGTHGTHNTYGTTEGNHGPHDSKLANTLDPRVDSDRDGSRTMGTGHAGAHGTHTTAGKIGAAVGGTHGTGPAPHTAGPHKSDMANKLDPRVDSDLDGSRTAGNNQTFSQS